MSNIILYGIIQDEHQVTPFLPRHVRIFGNQTAIRHFPIISNLHPLPRENWSKNDADGLTALSTYGNKMGKLLVFALYSKTLTN